MAVDKQSLEYLVDVLNFPKESVQNRVLSKDDLVRMGGLNSRQKQELTDAVKQVNWVLLMTEDNTKISNHVGEDINVREINYLVVELKQRLTDSRLKEISKTVLGAIPKATILEVKLDGDDPIYWWITADYKLKRGYDNLLSVGNTHATNRIGTYQLDIFSKVFDFQKQVHLDLKYLYDSFSESIERYNFEQHSSRDLEGTGSTYADANQKLRVLEVRADKLQRDAKKETQLNKRMQLVQEYKLIQKKIDKIRGA